MACIDYLNNVFMLFEEAWAYNILDPSVSQVAQSAVLFLPVVLNKNIWRLSDLSWHDVQTNFRENVSSL